MKRRRGHAAALASVPRDLHSPTVVIVHGAWADATSWRDVIAILQASGVSVTAVQNPLTALADDVDAVMRAINQQQPPVVLVGHGYGGTVITQAGNHQSVRALVYVAASAPDVGESTADVHRDYLSEHLIDKLEVDSGGYLYLKPDALPQFVAHDLPATDGLVLAAAQPSIRASALLDRVTEAAWRTRPSWYIVTLEDRMISHAVQRSIASRINASVFVLRTGHVPFLSKPKETADAILAAVDFVRQMA